MDEKLKLLNDLASLFRLYRERLGLSQKELAERMGVPQSAVARIEIGEAGISSVTLARFCEATGLKINFLPAVEDETSETEETDVFDICDLICIKAKELLGEDYDVTNMKLNKLLYYVQMAYVGTFGSPLFQNDFEAWQHGPVCPEVYHRYKGLGASTISEASSTVNVSEPAREVVNQVLEQYGRMSAFQLRQKTHTEQPWIKASKGDNKISLEDMRFTFTNNKFFNF